MINSYLYTSSMKFNSEIDDPGYDSHAVVLDLEDGVHKNTKEDAREALRKIDLTKVKRRKLIFGVRINQISSVDGIRDIELLYKLCTEKSFPISFIKISKTEDVYEVLLCKKIFADLSKKIQLIPIIETPKGLENIYEISALSDAMMFGQVDMSSNMYQRNKSFMDYARGKFCVACAQNKLAAIDTAAIDHKVDITDVPKFEEECLQSKSEGFTGKAIIHPCQVPIVNKIYSISGEEIAEYKFIIEQYAHSNEGFSIKNSKIIAPPFISRAKLLLQLYDST